jgi:hypothetical protein
VTDVLGKIVMFKNFKAKEGYNSSSVEFGNLPAGLYLLELSGEGNKSETLRIVIE